jgi:hypothetical protein
MLGFDLYTLIVLVALGGAAFTIAWNWPFRVLAALILLIPFRDLSIRWMNASTNLSPEWVNALSRWWFVIVLALSVVLAIQWLLESWRERNSLKLKVVDYLFVGIIIFAVIHTILSPNIRAGITSLRGYVQPMAIFVLARAFRPTRTQLQTLLLLLLIAGIIMISFELWQVFMWTEADYRAAGYLDQSGRLVTPTIRVRGEPFIRPTSTVSGPNELAISMLLLAAGSALGAVFLNQRWRWALWALTVVSVLGSALTFSRSGLLGLGVSVAALIGLLIRARARGSQGSSRKNWAWVFGSVGLALLVFNFILSATGNSQRLAKTFQNLTNEYHIKDSLDAIEFLTQQPTGVGMGMVTPKGALVLMDAKSLYHVEGSLFQIAMEMGVWGLAIWLAFWGVCLTKIWRFWKELEQPETRILAGTAFTGWIGAMVAFVFLPLMQSISLMVWLWFLLGFAMEARNVECDWVTTVAV